MKFQLQQMAVFVNSHVTRAQIEYIYYCCTCVQIKIGKIKSHPILCRPTFQRRCVLFFWSIQRRCVFDLQFDIPSRDVFGFVACFLQYSRKKKECSDDETKISYSNELLVLYSYFPLPFDSVLTLQWIRIIYTLQNLVNGLYKYILMGHHLISEAKKEMCWFWILYEHYPTKIYCQLLQ